MYCICTGPFCGKESLTSNTFLLESNEVTVVFYSDPAFGWRRNGVLRILLQTQQSDSAQCPVWHLDTSAHTAQASCGVVLSPNFPGLVTPGLWFWVFKPPAGVTQHFAVTVFYVRGPDVIDLDCSQSLTSIQNTMYPINKDWFFIKLYSFYSLRNCSGSAEQAPV